MDGDEDKEPRREFILIYGDCSPEGEEPRPSCAVAFFGLLGLAIAVLSLGVGGLMILYAAVRVFVEASK